MREKKIGFLEAFSIGVGGMIGGGIFAVLGLTIDLAKGAAPISFFIAGVIALLTAYSYAKLSVRYPSEGGSIEFIVQAYGNNLFSAIINNLLLVSYVIMLALYAYAFGSYGSVLLAGQKIEWLHKLLASAIILVFMVVNLLGAFITGKAEDIMVIAKVLILVIFAAAGSFSVDLSHLSPQNWAPFSSVVTGGLIIFLAYEGFELIANTARDVKEPQKTLPKAYYASVILVMVIYIWIAIVTVGNLSFEEIKEAQDYVLAKAAEPFFGEVGFIVISFAALLSTASAINATLYGSGRISYLIAKYGELPKTFEEQIKNGYEGTIIIALLAIIFATSFNLDNISVAGSMGFLIVFTLVNYANFKLYKETKANRFIAALGAILGFIATIVLIGYNLIYSPHSLITSAIVVVAVVIFNLVYYHLKRVRLARYIDKHLEEEERRKESR
ncbi:MAG: amino acid permease [Epsilonproteobacteria bacterium]|nr:amino acid permease [Campylobacterota bacterium]